jgi:4-hydroxybenzoate polyprenyltransferase
MTQVHTIPGRANASPSIARLGRVKDFWSSKVAPVLGVAYCASLLYGVGPLATARTTLVILFVGLCAGSYGHFVNDSFDVEVDARAGKQNRMARCKPWQRMTFCAAAAALGFLPGVLFHWSLSSIFLLALEYLLPTVYSVPPIRLKGRGLLGLLADSSGSHLVPCLYAISLMAHDGNVPMRRHLGSVCVVSMWALCLGLVGIVIHEFEDRANDLQSGIETFATATTFDRVRMPMTLVYLAEVASFAILAGLLVRSALLVGICAASYVGVTAIRLRTHWEHFRHVERPRTAVQWWQLSHPFYETVFPLAAALECAYRYHWLTVLPILQLGVFAAAFREQAKPLREVWSLLVVGGRLQAEKDQALSEKTILLPFPAVRVESTGGRSERWSIRLVQTGTRLRRGSEYWISLRIRSETARTVALGIWQDHEPWNELGYYEVLPTNERWQTIWRRVRIVAGDRRGQLAIWLGEDEGAVEIRRLRMVWAFWRGIDDADR